jgi:uncharacterized membrane protein YczE
VSSAVVDQPCPDGPAVAVAADRSRWLAWSRPGAIAAVIAMGVTPRMMRGSVRLGLLVSGSLVIAVGVAVMLWTGLGPGPLDVFIGAIRARTGLSLTLSVWLVIAALISVAWALGRRPGPGTLVSPLLIGPTMEAALTLLGGVEPPDALPLVVGIHVIAVFVVGVGAGALIVSGLGAGTGELLAAAAAERTGRSEPRLRMAFESSLLVVGVALGGPVGLGTVVVALCIGPAVMVGYRAVDSVAARGRIRFDAARAVGVRSTAGSVDAVFERPTPVAEYCDGKQ